MLKVNQVIAHVDAFEKWSATVVSIEGNDLKVIISSATSGQWPETWNLAHTLAGIDDRTYYVIAYEVSNNA